MPHVVVGQGRARKGALALALVAWWSAAAWTAGRGDAEEARLAALERVLDAIRAVETGGSRDGGRGAVGDGGRAIGPFQIHRAYWEDSGVPGRYEDCRDPRYARRVVLAYWQRWCPRALEECDAEVLARTHNGGPRGAREPRTMSYWIKVRNELRRTGALADTARAAQVLTPGDARAPAPADSGGRGPKRARVL